MGCGGSKKSHDKQPVPTNAGEGAKIPAPIAGIKDTTAKRTEHTKEASIRPATEEKKANLAEAVAPAQVKENKANVPDSAAPHVHVEEKKAHPAEAPHAHTDEKQAHPAEVPHAHIEEKKAHPVEAVPHVHVEEKKAHPAEAPHAHTDEKQAHPTEAPHAHTEEHKTPMPAHAPPNVTASEILTIWYGEHEPLEKVGFSNQAIWYKKDPEFDAELLNKFELHINHARNGDYDSWLKESGASGVALAVLLDQFSRNMFRGTSASFAYDAKALSVSKYLAEHGLFDLPLPMFYNALLPMMHSEDRADQRALLETVDRKAEMLPEDLKERIKEFRSFAVKHADIVERFGRFPHRNSILGRESTPEEEEWMKTNTGL
jgi:uncharacterized protein (DUF924 family)